MIQRRQRIKENQTEQDTDEEKTNTDKEVKEEEEEEKAEVKETIKDWRRRPVWIQNSRQS